MFIGGSCHGAISNIEGYFILGFQGLEDRWQFSTENLAKVAERELTYSRKIVHVCVSHLMILCVFLEIRNEKKTMIQHSHFLPLCSRDPIPFAILVELQWPEITSRIKVHWSATANCWMPWDMPSARWRTWRTHYCKAWGEWKPTKPLDYGCLKLSMSSCEAKWLLQILECFA